MRKTILDNFLEELDRNVFVEGVDVKPFIQKRGDVVIIQGEWDTESLTNILKDL